MEGDYKIELGLSWPEFGHRITTRSTFSAEVFPSIQVIQVQTERLNIGERIRIATIRVLVDGHPYSIPTKDLTFTAIANMGENGHIEIKPREYISESQAWQYDVYLTPLNENLHSITFSLNTKYTGKEFKYQTESLIVSSVLPITPTQIQNPVTLVPTSLPPVQKLIQPPAPIKSPGFPWWALSFPVVLLIALSIWAIYWITQTRPYGYLFNDSNQMIVDFSTLKRSTFMRILFKNSIQGRELDVPGLGGVSFDFNKKGITLNTRHITPTIRVNDQPVIEQTSIMDKAWIGTHGRLFTFLMSPLILPDPGTGTSDDD
jgi:hypothetical protein